jgi:hypothetical protein
LLRGLKFALLGYGKVFDNIIAEKGKPGESRGRKANESKAKGYDGRVASMGKQLTPIPAPPE